MLSKFAFSIFAAAIVFALVGATSPAVVASKASATTIAHNPQPLPPGDELDPDHDFDFG
jgi:hypothetical protein